MSRYDDDDDDFDNDGEVSINSIRKALRAEQKQRKALEQELSEVRKVNRQRSLADAITAKGINPLVAGLIPSDVTDDGLDSWLDTYGSLFAPQGAAVTEPDQGAPEPPEGAATFQQVASTGAAPVGDESQILALIQGARTKEELDRLIFG